MLIGALQLLHRALSISHETTGTLSNKLTCAWHAGQNERAGRKLDNPSRGERKITTFAKLPTTSPKAPESACTAQSFK